MLRRKLYRFLQRALYALTPKPDHQQENKFLKQALNQVVSESLEEQRRADAYERVAELVEARRMAGAGPWRTSESVLKDTDRLLNMATESLSGSPARLRETTPAGAIGATGDIELALQNVEWRREVNLSWLEFSRWGIQQIILISRLYYIKNPLIQRGINVAAHYVFGRGVEVSSEDESANDLLHEFFDRNKSTLGQIALTDLERRKYYDGNLFFVLFPDKIDTGKTNIRTIDATEVMDIVADPDDSDTPHYYLREWTEKIFEVANGSVKTGSRKAWYPALNYEPANKPQTINQIEVKWDSPVLHRKCGAVAKWSFGCPLVYAALDWAKAARRFLEHCATVKQALAQISMTLTTKGGQQALMGAKTQLQTTVGPTSNLWDTNPPTVDGGIFASGPGTTLAAFKTSGAGGDPEEVRRYILMVAIVFGIPETFFADVKTGNLATAQSLDRPTELNFLEKQQAWAEDLETIGNYVVKVSAGATSGKLREAKVQAKSVKVTVTFPSILEGDIKAEIDAVVEAMTLGNKAGQVVGIDEKEGVKKLFELVGIEAADELMNAMYPDKDYDPNRAHQILTDPIPKEEPGGSPKLQQVESALRRLAKTMKLWEVRNGDAEHVPHR